MNLREIVDSDLGSILEGDGVPIIFKNLKTEQECVVYGLPTRISQSHNPLVNQTEYLALHCISVKKSSFSLEIPDELHFLKVSWKPANSKIISAVVKEYRPTDSMGLITFICQTEIDASEEENGA